MKEEIREKLGYLKQSIFHPFDGFYEIRFRKKGSTLLAVFLLMVLGFCAVWNISTLVLL